MVTGSKTAVKPIGVDVVGLLRKHVTADRRASRQTEPIAAERCTATLHLNANYHREAERAKNHRFQLFCPW